MAGWNISEYYRNLSTLINRINYFKLPIELKVLRELENLLYSKISGTHPFEIDIKNVTIHLDHSISGTTPTNVKTFVISFDLN